MEIDKVKNYFWTVFTLLLAGLFLNLVFFVMPMLQKLGDSFMPVRTITVSAEGKTTVAPDLAQFSFSVVTRGGDPSQIVDENNKKVSVAIEFVKSQGIEAKDIKTSGYNLSPEYQYDDKLRRSFIVGYTITQSVNVKVRDFNKLPKILSGLTPVGINQISGISFSVEDPEKFMREARKIAFERAKAKAQSMASQNGVGLGKVVNINEFGGPTPIPYFRGVAAFEGKGGDIAPPTIEPGTEEITVQVSVTYALR
ncbi:MAG: SIMPL domain-containing protein [Candidatus Liptonbacteria bacterium]|nr:SIMPL domain-containing protein [Candidatus Liptonbacteria bacterium]